MPIDPSEWINLRSEISGSLILAGESGYTGYTAGWNIRSSLPKFPLAVALPRTEADISTILKFAHDNGITLVPRSGGGSYIGASNTADLLLDLRGYTGVTITDGGNRVTVKSGTQIGQVYYDLYNYPGKTLTIPTVQGGNDQVGIGLVLGGGHSSRGTKNGVLCQRLRAARVVLYDGSIVECDNYKNSDLLWALKGGGGVLGVVSEYTLEPQEHYFQHTWAARYDLPGATAALKSWQNFTVVGGSTLDSSCFINWPASTSLNTFASGGTGMVVEIRFRGIGTSGEVKDIMETCGILPVGVSYNSLSYSGVGSAPAAPPYTRTQERTYHFGFMPRATFTDAAINVLIEKPRQYCQGICGFGPYAGLSGSYGRPSSSSGRPPEIIMHRYQGVISGDNTNSNSFANIKAIHSGQFRVDWNASDTRDEIYGQFMRDFFHELASHCGYTGIGYVNYPLAGLTVGGVSGYANVYWGENLYPLQQVKKAYDPNNFFNIPHTIPPLN